MQAEEFIDSFIWGLPEEVSSRVLDTQPSFRLTHPAGALKGTARAFGCVTPTGIVREIRRGGRLVGKAWEDENARWCFIAGLMPADLKASRKAQAEAIFPELNATLQEAGLSFRDVVRTWFYVDSICQWYGEFNAARSAWFEANGVFEHFLPASTGIGSANLDGAALIAGAIAMQPKHAGVRAEIVESPLQAPAMAYRSSFSRAAEIITPGQRTLFISGTASIAPNSHEVEHVGDSAAQIACTMRAVLAILESRGYGWRDVTRAIVYLKDPAFQKPWQAWLAQNGLPSAFAAETVCDVCRDEWLFEIECDAVKGV